MCVVFFLSPQLRKHVSFCRRDHFKTPASSLGFSSPRGERLAAAAASAEEGRWSRLQRSIHLNLRLQLTPYKEVQLIRALSSSRQQWSPNAETPTSGRPGRGEKGSVCVFMGGGKGRPKCLKTGCITTSVSRT